MDEKLRDGRTYLVDNRFTAADLTLASLIAPVVFPKQYGSTLPEFEVRSNNSCTYLADYNLQDRIFPLKYGKLLHSTESALQGNTA